MSTEVKHQPEKNRYLFLKDGKDAGLADYTVSGNSIHITHTEINPEMRGQGLGEDMVRQILDLLRTESDLRVIGACSFVRDFYAHNPDYQELETR